MLMKPLHINMEEQVAQVQVLENYRYHFQQQLAKYSYSKLYKGVSNMSSKNKSIKNIICGIVAVNLFIPIATIANAKENNNKEYKPWFPVSSSAATKLASGTFQQAFFVKAVRELGH